MSDSRAALLAAGAEEFAKRGLDGTRVQAIVASSGVNERMIYHHFGNKEGLYRAVIETEIARLGDRILAARAEINVDDNAYHAMRIVLTALTSHFLSRPAMAGLWFHEAASGAQILARQDAMQEYPPTILRELYERGQREGTFRADVPVEAFHTTNMAAIVGLAALAPLAPNAGLEAGAEAIDQFVGQLLDGMSGPLH